MIKCQHNYTLFARLYLFIFISLSSCRLRDQMMQKDTVVAVLISQLNFLLFEKLSLRILLYLPSNLLYINKNHEQRFQEERVDNNRSVN